MEALGGGGHRTVAGVQLKGQTIQSAQQAVRDVIQKLLINDIEKENE